MLEGPAAAARYVDVADGADCERARRAICGTCDRPRCAQRGALGARTWRCPRVRRGPRRGADDDRARRLPRGRGRGRARRRRRRPTLAARAGVPAAHAVLARLGRRDPRRRPPGRRSARRRRSRGGRPHRPARHLRRPSTLLARGCPGRDSCRLRRPQGRGGLGRRRLLADRPPDLSGAAPTCPRGGGRRTLCAARPGGHSRQFAGRARARRTRARGLPRRAARRRRAAAPRRSAPALRRARPDRVRPRRRGRARRARLRDPGGDHVSRRRRSRVRRPRVDPPPPRRGRDARPQAGARVARRRAGRRDARRAGRGSRDGRRHRCRRASSRRDGLPGALERGGRDRRLRRDRGDARPRPGGGRPGGVGASRAGAPRGLRRLRARPGAAVAWDRAERLPEGRDALLVRRRRG